MGWKRLLTGYAKISFKGEEGDSNPGFVYIRLGIWVGFGVWQRDVAYWERMA